MHIISWLNTRVPARKRWAILLSAFLEGLTRQITSSRITALERRIEALENPPRPHSTHWQ